MEKQAIVILANNMQFLEIMLGNMPEVNKKYRFIIINEVRLGNKTKEISNICRKHKIKAEIIGSKEIVEIIAKNDLKLSSVGKKFILAYKMGMNILSHYYVMKYLDVDRLLFMDEDVIVTKDLKDLFKYKVAHKLMGFTYFRAHNKVVDEWLEISGLKLEEWKEVSVGQRILSKSKRLIDGYTDLLNIFFNNEIFYEAWREKKNQLFWHYQDQNFETALVVRLGLFNKDLHKHVLFIHGVKGLEKSKLETFKKYELIHYCSNTRKQEVLSILEQKGLIKLF